MSSPKKCSVEDQLAEYRARKKQEQVQKIGEERLWERLMAVMPLGGNRNNAISDSQPQDAATIETEKMCTEVRDNAKDLHETSGPATKTTLRQRSSSQESSSLIRPDQSDPEGKQTYTTPGTEYFMDYTTMDWIALTLKFVMYLILFKMFIILEFGAVFFIFSAFIFMWYNLRSGPKKKGEISAYSVFNPNCDPINGAISAEQFEREILHKY